MFLEEFLNFIRYRVSSGERYYWDCFGKNARYIDSDEVSDKGFIRASAVFDTETKVIYQLESSDDRENIGYRFFHPHYRNAYYEEAKARGVNPNQFFDDIEFCLVETVDEWREKSLQLLEEKEPEEYDNGDDFHMNNLKFSLTDFYRNYFDITGDPIEVQVKRYVNNLYEK